MSIVKRAVLLSIFAFPGAGQLLLKRYKSAAVIIGLFIIAVYIISSNIMNKAQVIADQIVAGQIALDVTTITQAILAQPDMYSPHLMTVTAYGVFILWQIAIIDAYRQAKRLG